MVLFKIQENFAHVAHAIIAILPAIMDFVYFGNMALLMKHMLHVNYKAWTLPAYWASKNLVEATEN